MLGYIRWRKSGWVGIPNTWFMSQIMYRYVGCAGFLSLGKMMATSWWKHVRTYGMVSLLLQ